MMIWCKVQLLVWIFVMRVMMVIASGGSYFLNDVMAKSRVRKRDQDELREAAHRCWSGLRRSSRSC